MLEKSARYTLAAAAPLLLGLALLFAPSITAAAVAPKRQKIAVMKVEAPELSKAAADLLRSGLELAISVLSIGRESELLGKENRAYATEKALLGGTSAMAQAVVAFENEPAGA